MDVFAAGLAAQDAPGLYHSLMASITGFVLAGGKSARMGRDKAFLEASGRSLLANALELARSVAPEVRIVGEAAKFSAFGVVVEDVYRDRGPLGGIHAALENSQTELNLILGVDLPFVAVDFLQYVIAAANGSDSLVTVARMGTYYEPLCAVYRRQFASLAAAALAANRNKVDALFAGIPLRVISDEELARNGFPASMFRNMNTPAEWKQAQQELAGREHVS